MAGVFGQTDDGPMEPTEDEIYSVVAEQAQELTILLADIRWLEYCRAAGVRPVSGNRVNDSVKREALAPKIDAEISSNHQAFENCLEAYAQGFGFAAADELRESVEQWIALLPEPNVPPIQRELFKT